MTEKWFECEYRPDDEMVLRFRRPKLSFLPAEAREHIWAAQKETLLAIRSFIDAVVESVEKAEKQGKKKGRTKIDVQ